MNPNDSLRQPLPSMQTNPQMARRVLINTASLTGSSLWRILLSFVLQLVIARRLGFEALGQYTVALAYLNVSQVFSELGLQALLIRDLAHQPERRRSFFWIALRFQFVAALIVGLALFVLTQVFAFDETITLSLWFVGVSLIFYAVTSVCETLFQAGERMELLLGVESVINLLIFGSSLTLLFLGTTVAQLVSIWVVTQLLSALLCLILLRYSKLLAGPQEAVALSTRELSNRAAPFFLLSLGDVLLQRADILLLSLVGNEILIGIYSAAYNIVRVLLRLIQSFWRALYPTLSRLYQKKPSRFEALSVRGLWYGMLLTLLAAAVGMITADGIVPLVFGEDATNSVPVFRQLSWLAPTFFFESYAIVNLMVAQRPRLSVQLIVIHLLALGIGIPIALQGGWGANGVALIAVAASTIGMGVGLVSIKQSQLPLPDWRQLGQLGFALVASLSSAILPLPWMGRGLIGAALFLGLLWGMGAIGRDDWGILRSILHSRGQPEDL